MKILIKINPDQDSEYELVRVNIVTERDLEKLLASVRGSVLHSLISTEEEASLRNLVEGDIDEN